MSRRQSLYMALICLLLQQTAPAQTNYYLTLHNLGCRQSNHMYSGFIFPHTDWSEGDLVQIILAGPNRVIDAPQANGLPGGDDQLAVNSGAQFGMNMNSFTHENYTFYSPQAIVIQTVGIGPANTLAPGMKWYVRCWNGPTVEQSSAYYNSRKLVRDYPLPGESCAMDSAVRTLTNNLTIPNLVTYAVTLEDNGHPFTPPTAITVLTPNGGEAFVEGAAVNIGWSATPDISSVDIYLIRNGVPELIVDATTNDGNEIWSVTLPASEQCRIRVHSNSDTTRFDQSDNVFAVAEAPSLTLTNPVDGDSLYPGGPLNIQWSSTGNVGLLRIVLTRDSLAAETLFSALSNDGGELWTVTAPAMAQGTLRIEAQSDPLIVFDSAVNLVIPDTSFAGPLHPPEVVLLAQESSLVVAWAPVDNAASYRVENSLDQVVWTLVGSTSDTLLTLPLPSESPLLQFFRVIAQR